MKTLKTIVKTIIVLILIAIVAVAVGIFTGVYPVGADVPHSAPVAWLLGAARDRAVAVVARGVRVPDLSDPKRILVGAGQYAAMCSSCHLAPGYGKDETWTGLYPRPPKLYQGIDLSPAEVFWIVKHGLKMTGMPAWGPTHDDDELWDIVAFVERLPTLSAQQYRSIVARAPMDADMTMLPMPGGNAPAAASSSG